MNIILNCCFKCFISLPLNLTEVFAYLSLQGSIVEQSEFQQLVLMVIQKVRGCLNCVHKTRIEIRFACRHL